MKGLVKYYIACWAFLIIPSTTLGGYFKCVHDGHTRYQSTPCAKQEKQSLIEVKNLKNDPNSNDTLSEPKIEITEDVSEQKNPRMILEAQLCEILSKFQRGKLQTLTAFEKSYPDLAKNITLNKTEYFWANNDEVITAEIKGENVISYQRTAHDGLDNQKLKQLFELNKTPPLKSMLQILGPQSRIIDRYTLIVSAPTKEPSKQTTEEITLSENKQQAKDKAPIHYELKILVTNQTMITDIQGDLACEKEKPIEDIKSTPSSDVLSTPEDIKKPNETPIR